MSGIVMYTTTWCGDCKRSKHFFDSHKVQYKEINIEENEEGMKFVEKTNDGMHSVPTIAFPDGSILVEPSNHVLEEKVKELGLL